MVGAASTLTGGVNIYLCGCISVLAHECTVCVFVCVISNQSTSKKLHHVSDISRLDALLHKTHIKVLLALRKQGSTCVDPLTKIAHQMLHDHPFCQRNRLNERTGGGQNLKGGGGGGIGKRL